MKALKKSVSINVHEAKTNFSKLLARVEAGEEITIAKAGQAVAKLIPLSPPAKPRVLGLLKNTVSIDDDFDDPLDPETFS